MKKLYLNESMCTHHKSHHVVVPPSTEGEERCQRQQRTTTMFWSCLTKGIYRRSVHVAEYRIRRVSVHVVGVVDRSSRWIKAGRDNSSLEDLRR